MAPRPRARGRSKSLKSSSRKRSSRSSGGIPSSQAAKGNNMQVAEGELYYTWRGAFEPHGHLSCKNFTNAAICLFVMLPSVLFVHFYLFADAPACLNDSGCAWLLREPFATVNLLFFLNVSVGFWLIGWLQKSFWLIDPYWTFLPPLIGHFYRFAVEKEDAARGTKREIPARSAVALALIWAWALRLTHNYFRRENWKFGEREDWRYTKMQKDFPKSWPILSFFAVGIAQQPMLVGISWPLLYLSKHSPTSVYPPEFTAIDAIATAGAVAGIAIAFVADNQLRKYMLENDRRRASDDPRDKIVPVLDGGLWRYSRHPNYFGEQLFWWSVALFAVGVGAWWTVAGTAFNSLVLVSVTKMTEERIVTGWDGSRVKLWREYARKTSPLIPWPPRA